MSKNQGRRPALPKGWVTLTLAARLLGSHRQAVLRLVREYKITACYRRSDSLRACGYSREDVVREASNAKWIVTKEIVD